MSATSLPQVPGLFLRLLDEYGMTQHVNTPTHTKGHILDLFITKNHADLAPAVWIENCLISDHFSVVATLRTGRPPQKCKEMVSSRNIKSVHLPCFSSSLVGRLPDVVSSTCAGDVTRCCKDYVSAVSASLDEHAPVITKHRAQLRDAGWMTPDISLRASFADRMRLAGEGLAQRCIVRSSPSIEIMSTVSSCWLRSLSSRSG